MARIEPQSANDYDDRTTAAVKSVLVEIGQILLGLNAEALDNLARESKGALLYPHV